MKRRLGTIAIAALFATASCGSDADQESAGDNSSTNSTSVNANANNSAANNATDNTSANATTNNSTAHNSSVETVQIECVSDLVTASGNYYAVTAEITAGEARVELITYLAATPTSDPVEEAIWNEQVAAQFSPVVFAYQTQEHFLDVTKSADEAFYRGTMSGETEFGDAVNATCWPVDLQHPATYSAESGTCVDTDGELANNNIPWMVALRTGFGQCTRFEGALAEDATGATFDFIDLRGADFSDAVVRNTAVQDVQLEGADLSAITIESASVSGTKDAFTTLPTDGCQDDGDTFSCAD